MYMIQIIDGNVVIGIDEFETLAEALHFISQIPTGHTHRLYVQLT